MKLLSDALDKFQVVRGEQCVVRRLPWSVCGRSWGQV